MVEQKSIRLELQKVMNSEITQDEFNNTIHDLFWKHMYATSANKDIQLNILTTNKF